VGWGGAGAEGRGGGGQSWWPSGVGSERVCHRRYALVNVVGSVDDHKYVNAAADAYSRWWASRMGPSGSGLRAPGFALLYCTFTFTHVLRASANNWGWFPCGGDGTRSSAVGGSDCSLQSEPSTVQVEIKRQQCFF
jgi:hypothetical protein